MLLIHLAQVYLVVRNSLKRGEILICDRYVYDSIVDLQQEFHFSPKFIHEIFNSKWIPQPNFRYLLDLPEQQAFVRKTDTESVEFLNVRREIYKSFANEYELVVIDATNPVDVILKTITDTIEISAIFEKGFS